MPASRKEETMGATSTTPKMNAPIRRIVLKRARRMIAEPPHDSHGNQGL